MDETPTLKQLKQKQKPPVKVNRQKKLSQALRENLARRKAQMRGREVPFEQLTFQEDKNEIRS